MRRASAALIKLDCEALGPVTVSVSRSESNSAGQIVGESTRSRSLTPSCASSRSSARHGGLSRSRRGAARSGRAALRDRSLGGRHGQGSRSRVVTKTSLAALSSPGARPK
jgi:hypothetical protein